jgi:uncharacterized surface protein with fasciclin (FAS1) repeats
MKRHAAVLAVLPVLALGAAACGDDEETPAAAAPQEQAAEAPVQQGEDVVALAQGNQDLSTLVDAVTAADLAGTLQGEGPFTVFAPTNAAFAKVPKATLDKLAKNPAALKRVLLYHVVAGKVPAAKVVTLKSAKTLAGATVKIRVTGKTVRVNSAKVTKADVKASNGIVHVIDRVLLPPA